MKCSAIVIRRVGGHVKFKVKGIIPNTRESKIIKISDFSLTLQKKVIAANWQNSQQCLLENARTSNQSVHCALRLITLQLNVL